MIENFVIDTISNSNWTEWSTIQGVITQVISKLDEHEARGRFEVLHTPYSKMAANLLLFCLHVN